VKTHGKTDAIDDRNKSLGARTGGRNVHEDAKPNIKMLVGMKTHGKTDAIDDRNRSLAARPGAPGVGIGGRNVHEDALEDQRVYQH
jgi:hypothetical protein